MSKWIGLGFTKSRDRLAKCLLRLGLGPNALTVAGLVFTVAAAVCLVQGAGAQENFWRLWTGVFLVLCGAADMLDGAMARLGGKTTTFGGFLDSVVDRYSDVLLFLGIGIYYGQQGNLTYQVLSTVGMANALIISYAKARAEDFISSCRVGYWERGERSAALTIAVFAGGIPAVLWELAVFPFFTGLRRIQFTRWAIGEISQENKLQPDYSGKPSDGSVFDRCRRGTLVYDIVTGAYIAFIIFAPINNEDLFRSWFS
ncbi:MAG: hypothetical protein GWP14_00530 [Actinobacteria bacterium]|nr:hypothetical protein [Actinomycetota bacterium]